MVYIQILVGISCVVAVAAAIYYNVTTATHSRQSYTSGHSQRTRDNEYYNETSNPNRTRKSKPGDKCVICTEVMTKEKMHTMICGHALHKSCYDQYRPWRRNCPYCEKIVIRLDMPGDNCSICCFEMQDDNMQYLNCEHALHQKCYENLISNKMNKCPVCMRSF